MKRLWLVLTLVAVAFLGGGFAGWIAFREPTTLLHSAHTDTTLSVYSYYLNSRGEKVLHGWSYQYRFENGTHHQSSERFVHGKSVFRSDGIEYRSAEQFDPPPAFLGPAKKENSFRFEVRQ